MADRKKTTTTPIRLGHVAANGVSASMYGLLERGAAKRPRIAKSLRGTVEIRFREDVAGRRVKIEGSPLLARRLLKLLEI